MQRAFSFLQQIILSQQVITLIVRNRILLRFIINREQEYLLTDYFDASNYTGTAALAFAFRRYADAHFITVAAQRFASLWIS
ncbi:hypothetical protein AXW84_07870 [Hymenobacter sp. PAMC 26628]|nr:hypothetical protein AXW84_07870 [Hymenobacter sp. PAMC 26628]